jgi:hypothetical protein
MLELARWTRANSSCIQERGCVMMELCIKREDCVCPLGCHCALYHVAGLAVVAEAGWQRMRCAQLRHAACDLLCQEGGVSLVGWDVRGWTSDAQKCVSLVSGGTIRPACGVLVAASVARLISRSPQMVGFNLTKHTLLVVHTSQPNKAAAFSMMSQGAATAKA